jgi:hypothetical protein
MCVTVTSSDLCFKNKMMSEHPIFNPAKDVCYFNGHKYRRVKGMTSEERRQKRAQYMRRWRVKQQRKLNVVLMPTPMDNYYARDDTARDDTARDDIVRDRHEDITPATLNNKE